MCLKSKEGKSLDLSMGLVIQSINFDKTNSIENSKTNKNNNRRAGNNCTPLLDNIQADQIDSDHD